MKHLYGIKRKRSSRSSLPVGFVSLALVWAIICMSWCTQSIASLYAYHAGLGEPVFHDWYWPWQCIVWTGVLDESVLEQYFDDSLTLFVVPLILVFIGLVARELKTLKDLHGTAHWADMDDIEKAGLFVGEGVYVGGWQEGKHKYVQYLQHNGPEHVLAFAPTRSGKGVGLVLPTLLAWQHSSVTLDIKGENWALTAGYRKQLGHMVLKFEPTDTSGASARFNPLAEVRFDMNAVSDVQNICTMIMDPDGKGLRDYFDKAGLAFLVGIVLHVLATKHTEKKLASLADVIALITHDRFATVKDMFAEVLDTKHSKMLQEAGIALNVANFIEHAVHSSASECNAKADKELSGVVSSAMANLSLYRDPIVAQNTSVSDFRINDLMNSETPVDLYLVVRPSDLDRLRPLMRLFLNVALRRLTEGMKFSEGRSVAGYKHRLLLMLDEFTSLGKLEIMQRALAFMAGYGVKAYIIVQDLTQLQEAYTKDEAITSNCHIRIAYAPNKIETARLLSEMVGKTTVVKNVKSRSHSKGGASTSHSIQETARPLLTPDECMRLPGARKDGAGQVTEPGDMLIFAAGFSPIYGKQILYFLDPVFSARSKIPAPTRSDSMVHAPSDKIATLFEEKLGADHAASS